MYSLSCVPLFLFWHFRSMGYLFSLFFLGGHQSTHCFISDTCPFFFGGHQSTHCFISLDTCPFFCVAHTSSLPQEYFERKNHDMMVEFILVDGSMACFAYSQCRSSMCMWSVRDLDLGSMINLSTRVNKTWQNSIQ